jgi:hypothetical protein
VLLKEAARVARKAVILKDHFSENGVDHMTLRFMDWVGNAPHGVVLPYNYASRAEWRSWYAEAGLEIETVSDGCAALPRAVQYDLRAWPALRGAPHASGLKASLSLTK